MGLANSIIRPTEQTTAAIITRTSSTMPTAVMMESSEKTRSITMICRDGGAKSRLRRAGTVGLVLALQRAMDLAGALPDQEQAPAEQDDVAARDRLVEDGQG